MFWIVNTVLIIVMAYLFGVVAALLSGVYVIIMALIIFRYNDFAVRIIDAQRKEIERLKKK